MKRGVLMSGMLIFYCIGFPCRLFSAQNESSSEVRLAGEGTDIFYSDKTFFSATRNSKLIEHVTQNVTVITREELDRWAVSDLDEALGLISGIVVQDSGHAGQVATAQIYGSKPREVRVMVDGITFNATTTGGIADLSQIPLHLVEKIEIIKGASSSVWGSAMGGVINIITRPTGKNWIPSGNAGVSFGEFGTQRDYGEISGSAGPLSYYGMGNYSYSEGFRPNGEELEKRGFGKLELPLSEQLKLKGSFGYSGSKTGEFDFPDLGTSMRRKVYSHYGSAGADFSFHEDVHSELLYKISDRNFRRDTLLFPSAAPFQFAKARSLIHEISYKTVWDISENQALVFGSDIGIDSYRDAVYRAAGTRFNVNKQTTRQAYYTNYQLSVGRFDFDLGTRLDAANSYGVNFDPSAGAAFRLPFWDSILRANVSRAFNAPSLVDRYLSVGTTISNPDLKAEDAIVYNTGIESAPWKWLRAKAVFFQTFLNNSVQTILRDDGLRQPVNISKERRTGFETGLKLGPWFGFSPSYDAAYVKAVDSKGVPLQDRPRMTHDLKINYEKTLKGWKFNCHLAGRHTDLVQYTNFTDPADQVFIFDGKIVLTLPKILYGNFSLFLLARNLTNADFSFDSGRNPNPRRNFESGITYRF